MSCNKPVSRLKAYRVTFTETRHMRIELKARSEDDAIARAERLWMEIDAEDPRFQCYGGDAFDYPEAEEVHP
jgi:hypothetical protein